MSDIFGGQESAGLEVQTGSEKPLSDQERALLQRLLSDPFSLPQQFKTWLVSYLEGSDLLLARSSVQGLSDLLGSGGGQGILGLLPAGVIFPYGGVDEPVGAKLCNGQAVSRTSFPRLWKAIGTLYGAGDGSTTFNVPDLRRRVMWGAGTGVGHGSDDGEAESARTIDHHHDFGQTSGGGGDHAHNVSGSTDTRGAHSHTPFGGGGIAKNAGQTAQGATGTGWTRFNVVDWTGATDSQGDHAHNVSGGTDGSGEHVHYVSGETSGGALANHSAYLVVGFIINY